MDEFLTSGRRAFLKISAVTFVLRKIEFPRPSAPTTSRRVISVQSMGSLSWPRHCAVELAGSCPGVAQLEPRTGWLQLIGRRSLDTGSAVSERLSVKRPVKRMRPFVSWLCCPPRLEEYKFFLPIFLSFLREKLDR